MTDILLDRPQAELKEVGECIFKTAIEGVLVVERPTFADGRGYFRETFRKKDLEKAVGYPLDFVQENHSNNDEQGTLRGIHIAPWDKFVYVPHGRVQQVVVDLREDSPTFAKYFSIEIGDSLDPDRPDLARHAKVFIPRGCGNGYLVLSRGADYIYQVTAYWYPKSETELAWNDPEVNIRWNIVGLPILSDRDKAAPTLKEKFPHR